jgi:hypothetical protein
MPGAARSVKACDTGPGHHIPNLASPGCHGVQHGVVPRWMSTRLATGWAARRWQAAGHSMGWCRPGRVHPLIGLALTADRQIREVGEWLRRKRRRGEAREQLRTARKRTIEHTVELTAQEAQVAGLARDGRTVEPGDRRPPVHQHAHGPVPPRKGVHEAGDQRVLRSHSSRAPPSTTRQPSTTPSVP